MIPTDVIEQLIGESSGWDQQDTMAFSFYDVWKDDTRYPCVFVDLEKGIVYDNDDNVVRTFAIKATLETVEAA
jgi:hypothetical protein